MLRTSGSFTLFPPYGTEGTVIAITAPSYSVIDFSAQSFEVYLIPDSVPLGAAIGIVAGTSFFGYSAKVHVIDSNRIEITIPALATDALKGVVPGHYGVRTGRWKLIYYYGKPLDKSGAHPPDTAPEWELYNMQNDPREMHNLYNDPKYAGTVRQLKAELRKKQQEAGDTPV